MKVGQTILFKELRFTAKVINDRGDNSFTVQAITGNLFGVFNANSNSLQFSGEEIRPVTYEVLADEQAT